MKMSAPQAIACSIAKLPEPPNKATFLISFFVISEWRITRRPKVLLRCSKKLFGLKG